MEEDKALLEIYNVWQGSLYSWDGKRTSRGIVDFL